MKYSYVSIAHRRQFCANSRKKSLQICYRKIIIISSYKPAHKLHILKIALRKKQNTRFWTWSFFFNNHNGTYKIAIMNSHKCNELMIIVEKKNASLFQTNPTKGFESFIKIMVLITAQLTQPRNTVGLNIINAYMISVLIKIVKLLVFFRFLSFVRSFIPIAHSIITSSEWRYHCIRWMLIHSLIVFRILTFFRFTAVHIRSHTCIFACWNQQFLSN